ACKLGGTFTANRCRDQAGGQAPAPGIVRPAGGRSRRPAALERELAPGHELMAATALEELAAAFGIASEYYDIAGNRHRVPAATLSSLLEAMDVRIPDENADEDIHRILHEAETERWRAR